MYTANTMASAIEALGLSLANSSAQEAESESKLDDWFAFGTQFHPEADSASALDQRIFEEFVDGVRSKTSSRSACSQSPAPPFTMGQNMW